MNQTTNYELSLYEGTDLFNPLTVENVNFNDLDSIIKAISNRAFSAATELLTGTVHAITRADSDCAAFIFPATANFTAGETFTVDGVQVTALLPSGTTLPTGAYVIGSNVLCVLNGTLMTVYCDAGSDAQTLQGHAASYFATDDDLDTLSGTVSNLSIKVGSAVLTTTAPDCSGAINELNTHLSSKVDSNNINVRQIALSSTGTYYTVDLPSGWAIEDCVIVGAQYHNANNGLWYNVNITDVAIAFQTVSGTNKVGALTTSSIIDKVKVAVYKYR